MTKRLIFAIAVLASHMIATWSPAQVVTIDDFLLVPADESVNVLEIHVDAGVLGSDTDRSTLTGNMIANLNVEWTGAAYEVNGFTILGGDVNASDVMFSLFGGLISATGTGLGGTPSTLAPPSLVTNGNFDAADHQFEMNRGEFAAAGDTLDFSATPVAGTGMGTGTVSMTFASANGNSETYDIEMSLPTELSQTFVIPDVPLFGNVDADVTASGLMKAAGTVTIEWMPGDFDRDGMLECDDIDQLGAAIRDSSTDLMFDINGNGTVESADYRSWITDIKGTILGDSNFDGVVDVIDFNTWNDNRFSPDTGWCEGDFDGDSFTDAQDLNVWTANKFTTVSVVPEPPSFAALLPWGLLFWQFAGRIWRRRH